MRTQLSTIIQPANNLFNVDDMRASANIDNDFDMTGQRRMVRSAVALVEDYIARPLLTRTYRWAISQDSPSGSRIAGVPLGYAYLADSWASGRKAQGVYELPVPSVTHIGDVVLSAWDGSTEDLVLGDDYHQSVHASPARLIMRRPINWAVSDALLIDFTAGYGPTPDSVPDALMDAVIMTFTSLYEHRGDDHSITHGVPPRARDAADPYRWPAYGIS